MEKEKEKEKEIRKAATLCLETRARSEGSTANAFKAWCPKPTGWEPPTECSLHECWILEIIRSLG